MISFVTTNKGKFVEAKKIAEKFSIEIRWVNLEYPEIQGESLEEVAYFSIKFLSKEIDDMFFIEDSGLFINSLKGFPGIYSSYVFKTIGNEGILKLMEGVKDRSAYFKAVVAFYDRSEIHTFIGITEGRIANEIRGDSGFGFDPIFEYNGRTFAEMGEGKNEVSHRRKALEKFFSWLTKNF